jgi:hypothetical protein
MKPLTKDSQPVESPNKSTLAPPAMSHRERSLLIAQEFVANLNRNVMAEARATLPPMTHKERSDRIAQEFVDSLNKQTAKARAKLP